MKQCMLWLILLCCNIATLSALEHAIFAGGCFWCVEHDFDQINGVTKTISGFCGGIKPNPSYNEVSKGNTGYVESVLVTYDTEKTNYEALVNAFWHMIDPTQNDGQFCDKGSQYRPVIFYLNEEQKQIAERSKETIISEKKNIPILVEIAAATTFYPANEYHQDFYKKHSYRYNFYRYSCGRDARLKEIWGS